MAKIHPFWWFLAPTVTTFWEDRCETYPNSWVCLHPSCPCPWSLNGVPAEGSHCFKGYTIFWAVTTILYKTITPVTLSNPFNFRFYLKPVTINSDELFIIKLTNYTVGVLMRDVDATHAKLYIRNKGSNSAASYTITKNAWHLIRCNIEQVGANVINKLYINGAYKGLFGRAWTFGDLNDVRIQDLKGNFEHYVDHFRVTDL